MDVRQSDYHCADPDKLYVPPNQFNLTRCTGKTVCARRAMPPLRKRYSAVSRISNGVKLKGFMGARLNQANAMVTRCTTTISFDIRRFSMITYSAITECMFSLFNLQEQLIIHFPGRNTLTKRCLMLLLREDQTIPFPRLYSCRWFLMPSQDFWGTRKHGPLFQENKGTKVL